MPAGGFAMPAGVLKKCDVCGLPSDSLVRGRCAACIISRKGNGLRFFNLSVSEKIRALVPPLAAMALGWSLMTFSVMVFWTTIVWSIGLLVFCMGFFSLPVILFFGPVDWW